MARNRRFACVLFLLQLLHLVSSISTSKPLQGSRDHSPSEVLATTDDDVYSRGKGTDNYYNVGGRKMAGVKTVSATNKEGAAKVGVNVNGEEKQSVGARIGGEEEEEGQVVHETGFVTFNADYHPPRHHPPKNN